MARLAFTANIQRHVHCPAANVSGGSVRELLEAFLADHPTVRGYLLDDQGALRPHMVIFVDGTQIRDRERLSDPVADTSEVYVLQALSGG
jgi:molybdopterin converting factor small subunit